MLKKIDRIIIKQEVMFNVNGKKEVNDESSN
jgi:hypothetical protein